LKSIDPFSLTLATYIAAVERLLAEHWQQLSLVERMKFLLKG